MHEGDNPSFRDEFIKFYFFSWQFYSYSYLKQVPKYLATGLKILLLKLGFKEEVFGRKGVTNPKLRSRHCLSNLQMIPYDRLLFNMKLTFIV
jgi:hypothetical protein